MGRREELLVRARGCNADYYYCEFEATCSLGSQCARPASTRSPDTPSAACQARSAARPPDPASSRSAWQCAQRPPAYRTVGVKMLSGAFVERRVWTQVPTSVSFSREQFSVTVVPVARSPTSWCVWPCATSVGTSTWHSGTRRRQSPRAPPPPASGSLFKADAVNEEDSKRDRATQV